MYHRLTSRTCCCLTDSGEIQQRKCEAPESLSPDVAHGVEHKSRPRPYS